MSNHDKTITTNQTSTTTTANPRRDAVREHRDAVAAQDRAWREQGQREEGGTRAGWGL